MAKEYLDKTGAQLLWTKMKEYADNIDSDKTFVFEQATPSNEWTVVHNLNKNPSITVVDSSNNVVEGDYEYIDVNTIKLYFSGAFAGKAFFN